MRYGSGSIEIKVTKTGDIEAGVSGKICGEDVYILQEMNENPWQELAALCIAAETAKQNGARTVTGIVPVWILGRYACNTLHTQAMDSTSDDIKTISEKLEVINLQFSKQKRKRVRTIRWFLIALCVGIITIFAVLAIIQSAYLSWDYGDSELAVAGTILHGFEFLFVRLAPIAFLASLIGIVLTYRKRLI